MDASDILTGNYSFGQIAVAAVDDIFEMLREGDRAKVQAAREAETYFSDIAVPFKRAALKRVLSELGLEVDLSEGLTDKALTDAVNEGPLSGSGVVLESLVDRDALMRGLEALAISRAAAAFGLDGVASMAGLRRGVQEWLKGEVVHQLAVEAGSLIDGAHDAVKLAEIVAHGAAVSGWNEPSDMTAAGVSNRQRQAKYRQAHKRQWVEK